MREPGFYWVRFGWGWEPARWDGDAWYRTGIEHAWSDDVMEIGPSLVKPDGWPR